MKYDILPSRFKSWIELYKYLNNENLFDRTGVDVVTFMPEEINVSIEYAKARIFDEILDTLLMSNKQLSEYLNKMGMAGMRASEFAEKLRKLLIKLNS